MKDYKLLFAGLLLLLLIILIGIFSWLWISNQKNIDPLPIMVNNNSDNYNSSNASADVEDDSDTIATSILYLQAENTIKIPLDDVIMRFESRYPKIQVLARYVPEKSLLELSDTSVSNNQPSPFIVNIDIIIADNTLTQSRLAPLQTVINEAHYAYNLSQLNTQKVETDNSNETANNIDATTLKDNGDARNLVSFSYALKGKQALDGVILTGNPTAITFRNFLLSSAGQDILKQQGYENIDNYKSSMDDLFNPSSETKKTTNGDSVEVADALSNGV